MGSFFGHVLPGSFFIIMGIWWTIQIFRRFYKSLDKGSVGETKGFQSSVNFPVRIGKRLVNLDSYSIIVCCAVGLLVELVGATIKNHGHVGVGNMQHATMYLFFGMTALSAVILPRLRVVPRCDEVTYILLFLSFLVEGLLFKFHLFGREDVDVVLHTLLVYTIFACAAATLLEVKHQSSLWLPLTRSFCTILQGTWFWQAAFILYPPLTNPWGGHPNAEQHSRDTHSSLMFITCVFAWHMGVISILMVLCCVCIGRFYFKKGLIREHDLLDRHCAQTVVGRGYSSLQEDGLEQEDELL